MPFHFRLGKRSQQYNVANKDLFVIPIELLTNECIECTLLASSLGQECLHNVCQKINLQQPDYFGLLFKSKKNVDQWVDLTRPLKKQLDKHATEVRLYFRLLYFVPNFHFLSDEVSRYHYFCAMKGLVIEGRIACSRDDAILLASFSLQAEFGDYIPERHTVEYLNNFALFPKSMVSNKLARDVLVECAINAYRNLQGVQPNVAEIYYITEAQQRDGYGQEGFPAKDLDNGQEVCLGVCIRGIFVVNTQANTLELFKWEHIANLIHHKKVFTVERNRNSCPANTHRRNYSTYDGEYASCMWRVCVEQHQYYMKGVQSVTDNDLMTADHMASLPIQSVTGNIIPAGMSYVMSNTVNDKHQFYGVEALQSHKTPSALHNSINNLTTDYGQPQQQCLQPINSLYESINKVNVIRSITANGLPPNQYNAHYHDYTQNGVSDHDALRQRSSTEPIELQHIAINCAGNGVPTIQHSDVRPKTPSTASSPVNQSSSNTPIYENQLNSSDLTYEQRKKLLPAYKNPPDYDTFLKHKYSAMASLSQSMSSIPSRLASQSKMNSASSSSLVHPLLNQNGGVHSMLASSTASVAHVLPKPSRSTTVVNANLYTNYADLSNLDLDKSVGGHQAVAYRSSLTPESGTVVTNNQMILNQLRYQKQQMQSSGMITNSSPELNNLNLYQKKSVQFKNDLKSNGLIKHVEDYETNFNPEEKSSSQFCFTSVPDLTFQNGQATTRNSNGINAIGSPISFNKNNPNVISFGGKNLKLFNSRLNAGSEPNLLNHNYSNATSNCYSLQKSHLNSDNRSNSGLMTESPAQLASRQNPFPYSASSKIDKSKETSTDPMSPSTDPYSPNVYSPLHHQKIYVNLSSLNNVFTNSDQQPQPLPPVITKIDIPGAGCKPVLQQVNISSNHPHPPATVNTCNDVSSYGHITQPDSNGHAMLQASGNVNLTPSLSNVAKGATDAFNLTESSSTDSAYMSKGSIKSNTKHSRLIVFESHFKDQDFTREFELLPRMDPRAKFTTASLGENILKNRFRDILPYEENRLVSFYSIVFLYIPCLLQSKANTNQRESIWLHQCIARGAQLSFHATPLHCCARSPAQHHNRFLANGVRTEY